LAPSVEAIAAGSFAEKSPPEIAGTGYSVMSLEAALWAFWNSGNFRDGCLLAVNLGDDADTTAAVYGQIAGAFYGESGIPEQWLEHLHERDMIGGLAESLLGLAQDPTALTD
jgi:ADP-ribosylglycohydrolase